MAGGNTCRIRGALQPLLKAAPLSKSAVSRVIATLKRLEAWRTHSLTDLDVIFVYLDGFALGVRSAGKVPSETQRWSAVDSAQLDLPVRDDSNASFRREALIEHGADLAWPGPIPALSWSRWTWFCPPGARPLVDRFAGSGKVPRAPLSRAPQPSSVPGDRVSRARPRLYQRAEGEEFLVILPKRTRPVLHERVRA